jgi:hypothetical protein
MQSALRMVERRWAISVWLKSLATLLNLEMNFLKPFALALTLS